MDAIDGLNYVTAVSSISPRDMSKGMFRFVRAAARAADPRTGVNRPEVEKFRFAPAEEPGLTPAQRRLMDHWQKQDWALQPEMWGL